MIKLKTSMLKEEEKLKKKRAWFNESWHDKLVIKKIKKKA